MTVEKLIEILSKLPPQTPVTAWCPNHDQYEKVTGVVWADDGSEVMIFTAEEA